MENNLNFYDASRYNRKRNHITQKLSLDSLYPISESLSEDSFEDDLLYAQMHMSGPDNQNIAVWSYLKHETLSIFSPTSGDTLVRIIRYCERHLNFQKDIHKLMTLSPGFLTPIDLHGIYSVKPGAVIMVMPKALFLIKVEIAQLKSTLTISVDITNTVFKIKTIVRKIKGLPIERQDILYRDQSLDNNRRLLEYRITQESTLHVLIQPHFDLVLNIDTFWGKTYRFYVDPCSTGADIIYMVFNRTFSQGGPEDAGIHELYVPFHLLLLKFKNKIIACDYCLAYMKIYPGDKLQLTTVGHENQLDVQPLTVHTDTGKVFQLNVSKHDRWSIVAFVLHGLTDIPVDLISIFHDNRKIDFSSVIGDLHEKSSAFMSVVMSQMDSDLVLGSPLCVIIGNGIIENVRIAPHKTVKSLKKKLQRFGVPFATAYELVTNNEKLNNNSKIKDLMLGNKIPLNLQLERFPVFVHTPDGIIYKTFVNASQTVSSFKQKMELKSGIQITNCRMMIAGEEIEDNQFCTLFDSGVSQNCSIFIRPPNEHQNLYIMSSNSLVKLHLSTLPTAQEIRHCMLRTKRLPESSINCVLSFLYWFFAPKMSGINYINVRQMINQRMPIARQPLYPKTVENKTIKKVLQEKPRRPQFMPSLRPDSRQSCGSRSTSFIPSQDMSVPKSVMYLNGQKINITDYTIKENNKHLVSNHGNPPWVKDLHKRTQSNRFLLTDNAGGPCSFLLSSPRIHRVSRLKEIPSSKTEETKSFTNHSHSKYSQDDMVNKTHSVKQRTHRRGPWRHYYEKLYEEELHSDEGSEKNYWS